MNLKEWREKLLDLGRGNRLLNFKDSRYGSIEIKHPDVFKLYELSSSTLEFYNTDKMRKKFPGVTSEELFQTVELKEKQIFADKNGELFKTIKLINKKTNEYFEEKGINVLYLALGFLCWKDAMGEYEAPILLIPARIKTEVSNTKFSLDLDEEEIVVNPTLKYKLSIESNIILNDFEDSVENYLSYVQTKVKALEWFVNYKACLGMFSFMKINMYMDLKNNEKKILENANVNLLLGNPYKQEVIGEKSKVLHNVVDADSSQMEAILKIKEGKSLVLQGPPGTGKSQTITNVIAEALSDGKKILFVSEKLAALKVVYNKLKNVGLDEFCLELHSQKTNKKEVINALYDALVKEKRVLNQSVFEELEELNKNKAKLDEYVNSLHRVNMDIDKSVYEIYGELSSYKDIDMIDYMIPDLETKGQNYLKTCDELLQKYIVGMSITGYDYKTYSWYGYISKDGTYENMVKTKESMNAVVKFIDELNDLKEELYKQYNILVSDVTKVNLTRELFKVLFDMKFNSPEIFDDIKLPSIISVLKETEKLASEMNKYRGEIDRVFKEDIYDIDWEAVYRRYKKEYNKKFLLFNGKYKNDRKQLTSHQYNPKKLKYKEMLKHIENIFAYQELARELDIEIKGILDVIKPEYKGFRTDFRTIISQLETIQRISEKLEIRNLRNISIPKDSLKRYYDVTDYVLTRNKAKYEELKKCLDPNIIDIENTEFLVIKKKLSAMLREFDGLNAWINFLKLYDEMKDNELVNYIDEIIVLGMKKEKIIPTYHKIFYNQWLYKLLAKDEVLSNFNRITHDMYVNNFASKDSLQFEISKAQIVSKLSSHKPDSDVVAPKSPAALIKREYQKKRKQMPVRMLLTEIPEFIQTIKPCFLMSPLSVSTYLDGITFDLVVFDEASQIFPEDAIGSIYRAKQAVVVGDTKQMPPSNFFKSTSVEENEDYDESVNDYESILDICATCFNEHRLKWHYRSKTESLIGYSNEHFYNSELVSFPATTKDRDDFGVEFIYTKDGLFNRNSKSNKIEAMKTAELVIEHYKKYQDKKSLGVVAFSISQQAEIENALDKLRSSNLDLEQYFNNEYEPFFIKNLETVQGDERDTIILSIGYAKDETGKFYHNFGPLNQVGGERRLNVAITRAKSNVKVVASIRHTDINLDRTNSLGAELLKTYLYYAENENKVSLKSVQGVNTTKFEEEVAQYLKQNGFDVEMNVGYSQDKIDIAVKFPGKDEYALAIECDGNTYKNSKSTRDRDRLRREVLERCGWKYYRLWSTEWYKNNKFEREMLLKICNDAITGNMKKQEKQISNTVFTVDDTYKEFMDFTPALDQTIINSYKRKKINFRELTMSFLRTEAPLEEEYFLKRIVKVFEREKVTNVVREQYRDYKYRYLSSIIFKDGFMYLDDAQTYKLRLPSDAPRDIKHISKEELAGGMLEIVKANSTVLKDGLYHMIANLLKITRLNETSKVKLEEALSYLNSLGFIIVNGDEVKAR